MAKTLKYVFIFGIFLGLISSFFILGTEFYKAFKESLESPVLKIATTATVLGVAASAVSLILYSFEVVFPTEKRHNRNTADAVEIQTVSETEFRKELATMVDYAVNHAKPGVDVVDIFADRIFDCAKLEITKDIPIWKKSEKLIEGALLDRGTLYIPRYMIELSELKKLPKEE